MRSSAHIQRSFDFWRNLNHVDEVISQHVCNAESCPRMTIGPGDDVLWADNVRRSIGARADCVQQPRSAAAYIDSVCAWVEMVLTDKTVVRDRWTTASAASTRLAGCLAR